MNIQNIFQDLTIIIPLSFWTLFVIKYLSRWTYKFALKKGYPQNSATYFGRKVIHILGAGVTTICVPFLIKEPLIPFLSGLLFALYTYYFRWKKDLQSWFQVKENNNEVNFSIMWSLSLMAGWLIDKSFWLGIIPCLFISFGDGITGIVRNFRYQRRSKAWEGSLAMLLVTVFIGAWKMGWAGVVAAIVATAFERFEGIDDNISIVVSSFIVLTIFHFFFPSLTTPII